MNETTPSTSPRWNGTAKLIVALLIAIVIIYVLYRFQTYLAPLLLSFLIAYLVHPLAKFLNEKLRIPWRIISTIIFVFLFLILIGLLTWGGISIVEQVQNLIKYLEKLILDLPKFFSDLSRKPLMIGQISIDLSRFDLNELWTQLQGVVQPVLSSAGSLLGSIASGAATTVVGLIFILLIAYFIMIESGGMRDQMIKLSIPNYEDDIRKLGSQLSKIWNAFLRGQLLVFAITVVVYSILLSILGVRYFFLLALLAGLARFVPYVGPFVAWTTYGLVSLFQINYFGLKPLAFALIVVGCAWITDVIMDNFVSPRVMSNALKIHPAAVLVMVFISASLFGFIGVLLSAPLLASLQLFGNYVFRKLMDLDPWEGLQTIPPPTPIKEVLKSFYVRVRFMFTRHPALQTRSKNATNSNKKNSKE